MTRIIRAVFAMALLCGLGGPVRAADPQDATTTIDNAIKALGGEAQLSKINGISYTAKEEISYNGINNAVTTRTIVMGIDHYRQELDGVMKRNAKITGVTLLSGETGTRILNGKRASLSGNALASLKQTAYLAAVPITLLPLKDKAFKVKAIADATIANRPAAGIVVSGPDNKVFKLYFDKETGLPVKLVARIADAQGQEFLLESVYSDYTETAGIKKAMKTVSTRNGEKYLEQQITDFKVYDTVDSQKFQTP